MIMLAMCLVYLVVIATARSIPKGWAITGILLLHFVVFVAPPLLSADVFAYIDFARLDRVYGLNPYVDPSGSIPLTDPVAPFLRWWTLTTPYGPLFTLGSFPTAYMSVGAALWSIKLITVAVSLGCVALVWFCAARLNRPAVPAALFVGANPILLIWGVAGAHNDLIVVFLLLCGVAGVVAGREKIGAAFGVIGSLGVKVSLGVVLPFMLLGSKRRLSALLGAVAATIAVTVASVIAFGTKGLNLFSVLTATQEQVATNSFPNQVALVLGYDGITPTIRLAGMVLFGAVACIMLWRAWRGADWIACAGWTILAMLLGTAWLLPWYLGWLLPLAAICSSRRLQFATLGFMFFIILSRLGVFTGGIGS
jgi:hypothetical protein